MNKNRIVEISALIMYVSANSFMVFKQMLNKTESVSLTALVLFLYALISTAGIITIFKRVQKERSHISENSAKIYKTVFLSLSSLGFLIIVSSLVFIPMDSLNVDRWSALSYFWDSVLSGKYPYSVLTHLNPGNRISPLPVEQLVAFPFYLMGDVGLLQVFSWSLFSLLLYKSKLNFKYKSTLLLFVILSPIALWELMARSDFFTNLSLAVTILYALTLKREGRGLKEVFTLGVICGLVMSTRLLVAVPFFIFTPMMTERRRILTLWTIAFITFVITFLPFIFWDWELFKNFNPLTINSNKAPMLAQLITIAVSIVAGFSNISREGRLFLSTVLLFFLVLSSCISGVINYGWEEALLASHVFDIAYFSITIPFLSIWYYTYCIGDINRKGVPDG